MLWRVVLFTPLLKYKLDSLQPVVNHRPPATFEQSAVVGIIIWLSSLSGLHAK